ncbi:uncharacterized protein LOC134279402 [Saccostrea cucullata]|uniref:uncharacterized protein LOC134279402 n=1 Tax=Saccostrea cuccullata TaxID=36930 RepID=UPI002ED252DB
MINEHLLEYRDRREGQEIHDICLAAIIIAIIVVLLTPGVICFILWIKGSRRKSLSEEERPLTDILDFEDTSLRIQTVLLGEAVCMRSTVVSLEKATAFIGDNVNLKWTYKSPQMKQFKDISEDPERVTCCTTLPNPKLMIRRAYKRDEGEYKLTLNENKEEIFKLEVLGCECFTLLTQHNFK